jgi:hypothetical protein
MTMKLDPNNSDHRAAAKKVEADRRGPINQAIDQYRRGVITSSELADKIDKAILTHAVEDILHQGKVNTQKALAGDHTISRKGCYSGNCSLADSCFVEVCLNYQPWLR